MGKQDKWFRMPIPETQIWILQGQNESMLYYVCRHKITCAETFPPFKTTSLQEASWYAILWFSIFRLQNKCMIMQEVS